MYCTTIEQQYTIHFDGQLNLTFHTRHGAISQIVNYLTNNIDIIQSIT